MIVRRWKLECEITFFSNTLDYLLSSHTDGGNTLTMARKNHRMSHDLRQGFNVQVRYILYICKENYKLQIRNLSPMVSQIQFKEFLH